MAWDTSTLTNDGTLRVTSTVGTNITARVDRRPGEPLVARGPHRLAPASANQPAHVGLTTNWVTVPGSTRNQSPGHSR